MSWLIAQQNRTGKMFGNPNPMRAEVIVDTTRQLGFGQTTGSRGTLMVAASASAAQAPCLAALSANLRALSGCWSRPQTAALEPRLFKARTPHATLCHTPTPT